MHGTLSVRVLWEAQGRNKKELKNYAFRLHYRQKYDYNELNNQSRGCPMKIPTTFIETPMSDLDFSKWLKDHGWKGDSEQLKIGRFGIVYYTKPHPTATRTLLLASVKCDNQESTREIFINPTI